MDKRSIESLLNHVASGQTSVGEALQQLQTATLTDLGYAAVDHERGLRQGVSEVVFGLSKTPEQITGICRAMLEAGQSTILITRLSAEKRGQLPDDLGLIYNDQAQIGRIGPCPDPDGVGVVLVISAGTSDLVVAEEAATVAEVLGNRVARAHDVGVSGLHRLLARGEDIATAQVIICVAGMEGALPSVVAGMASCPVIAVPTSIGYGASFGGLAALLAMLNSCASGVSVVNIDNGFGAAYQAHLINHPRRP